MKSQQLNTSSFVGSRSFKPAGTERASSLRKSKMEGFDVVGGANAAGSAVSTVRNGSIARNRSKYDDPKKTQSLEQNINEQYIKGLQDETKLLEYELKLLKDKETEEQTNFTSFFKYFNDGVPINDQIIAMKNVYSSTQKNLSETILAQQTELAGVQNSNAEIEAETSEFEDRLKELSDIITKKKQVFEKEFNKYEKMFYDEMYTAKENEPETKELQKKTRYYQNEIMVFNRNRDKESMIAGRKEALDAQALEKIKKTVKAIEEGILEKNKEVDDRLSADAFEHDKQFLEEMIEVLKKRILSTKTDLSMVTVKIAEQKYILENQEKERYNEMTQRLALHNRVLDIKELIEDQVIYLETELILTNVISLMDGLILIGLIDGTYQIKQEQICELQTQQKMTEGLVNSKVKELERDRVRAVEQEIDHIQKRQIDLVQDRNEELEKNNDEIIYNKVELEKDIMDLEGEDEVLVKRIKEARERLHELKVDVDIGTLKERDQQEQIDPLTQKIEQLGKENPKRDIKVQDLQEQISKAEQQLDLINQFNNFNFEEAKMAYASNNQINKSIEKLVREYKKITQN